jgi:hypothetical protein
VVTARDLIFLRFLDRIEVQLKTRGLGGWLRKWFVESGLGLLLGVLER